MSLPKLRMVLFLMLNVLLVGIPAISTNTKQNQQSEMDNRSLAEFPKELNSDFPAQIEKYVSDRLGYRNEMITIYQILCDRLFQKLVHPSYIYGKNGTIYTDWDLATYQHLDVNKEFVDGFIAYLDGLSGYCEKKGAKFFFFLAPNKETIYPEFYPDGYNIKNQPNRSDEIIKKLKETRIGYIDPRPYFIKKKQEYLYNEKYDAGHWNDNGAFYGHFLILEQFNQLFPEMGYLSPAEFLIKKVPVSYLQASRFPIDEEVPYYELIQSDVKEDKDIFQTLDLAAPDMYHKYYINEKNTEKPKLLIFGDSYFGSAEKYYINHCSELLLLHSHNMVEVESYIKIFQPDIVLFEAVERVLETPGYIDTARISKRFGD